MANVSAETPMTTGGVAARGHKAVEAVLFGTRDL